MTNVAFIKKRKVPKHMKCKILLYDFFIKGNFILKKNEIFEIFKIIYLGTYLRKYLDKKKKYKNLKYK